MRASGASALCLVACWTCLVAGLAAAADAGKSDKGPVPLPLPSDPNEACSKAVFLRFTKMHTSCTFSSKVDPVPECCEALADNFGMDSTKPSRNCFCVPEVWERLNAGAVYHRLPLEKVFKYCSNHTEIVPYYQEEGKGYCGGGKDKFKAPAKAKDVESGPTFSNWASRLHKDWLMMTSFISGIVAVPGFLLFLWPFVFDLALTAKETAAACKAQG